MWTASVPELGLRIGLIVAWVAWAALLFGGFVFGSIWPDGTRRMPRWTRMASSVALVVAASLWALAARNTSLASISVWLAIGMGFGLLGDLCMAHLVPLREPVLGGMSAFGLGHIAYIVGLLQLGALVPAAPGLRWGAWIIWLLLGGLGWLLVVWRGSRRTLVQRIALPYALLLASTAGVASGLALAAPMLWPLALGAALFLLSDLLLAAQLFNNTRFRLISDVVWLLYGPGQMLIVYAMGAALARAQG